MYEIALEDTNATYSPDSKIVGYLHWKGIEKKTDRIEIRLIWFTQGKGDQDFQIVASQTISNPDSSGESDFEFTTPSRPYSFSGKLISLSWAIEIIEFPKLDAQRKEIVISKTGREVSLYGSTTETS